MLKSVGVFCSLVFGLAVALGGAEIATVGDVAVPSVQPAVVAPAVTLPPVTSGLALVGESEVISGDILRLTVTGVESKLGPDGIRVPKVRVGIDPPTPNLIREDSGYRLYLSGSVKPGEPAKVFTVTISVNSTDPNEEPQLVMRRFKVIPDSTVTVTVPVVTTTTTTTTPAVPVVAPSNVTAVVYVYEKDKTAIPAPVRAGLNKLNTEGKVTATIVEDDDVDGTAEVPDQYKVPLELGRAQGLPLLVRMSGDTVVGFVKDPKTEAQILEAGK